MPLETGSRLGPYEVTGRLGAGGMGEVYRARDSRLGRDVALKVLPSDVANDPIRRARFEQEARAAAALNHPNIVGTYDVGTEGGVLYMVSELVEGEGLDAILVREQLSTKRLLEIATQIADGMACAHAAGITHRDLKPANVMIARDGRAKILDFGLAKRSDRSALKETDATVTVHQTDPGMIVGTVNYMSPEQASGKPVDTRSDQFAFGVILFEMLTGKKAFERPTGVQTMSAILTDDPPAIDRDVPVPLRWVIERCLAKDPNERYESTRDLYRDLRMLHDRLKEASASQSAIAPVTAPLARKRNWALPAATFAAGVLAAVAAVYFTGGIRGEVSPTLRYTPFSFFVGGQSDPVWSPDGKAVAFIGRETATTVYQIYVRYLDSPTPTKLTNHPEGVNRILAWIGPRIFFQSAKDPAGWWSIAAVGGEPQSVLAGGGGLSISRGAISPDGKTAALLRRTDKGMTLWIASPIGLDMKEYAPAPFAAKEVYGQPQLKFSPDGKQILVAINQVGPEEMWVMPYPPSDSNPPKRVLPNLVSFGGTPDFSWMPDNRRVVISAAPGTGSGAQLWMADTVSGEMSLLSGGTTSQLLPSVSPDGTRLVFGEFTANADIVAMNVADASATRLVDTQRDESMPAWALRKDALVYVSDRNGSPEIWVRSGGSERPVVSGSNFEGVTQWFMSPALAPDADRVIYSRVENAGRARAWISSVAGGSPIRLTSDETISEFPGAWSPDGSWLVFLALRGSGLALMKVRTTGQAAPELLKDNLEPFTGRTPSWSPDGQWIEFDHQGATLISPDGKTERKLQAPPEWAYTFSADSKQLYGLRSNGPNRMLFAFDIDRGTVRDIGAYGSEFAPGLNMSPAQRMSLSPDGKTLVYPNRRTTLNLWLMEGLPAR